MKKYIATIALFFAGMGFSQAQDQFTALHYDVGVSLGNTRDYIERTSSRGIGFDYRSRDISNFGWGFTMAWHVFYEDKRNETFTGEDGTLSIHGTQFRYLNTMPLHLTAQYYFSETENPVQPFLSLGAGTTYFNQRTDMGMYSAIRNNWQFSIQPEVGVSISNGSGNSIFLAAKYINSIKTDSYDGQSYLSFNFGVTWDFIGY